MWNGYREPENAKLYEIGSGTKLLFTFLSLKVFRHEERETQSFYADCFHIVSSQPNQRAAPVAHKVVWPRPALKINLLLPRRELNSDFFQISKSSAHTSGHDFIHTPRHIFYLGFYFDISEWHILSTRAWTPALMLHLTNPCTKRKVLILTKPKGKIYKTKSLRHYITVGLAGSWYARRGSISPDKVSKVKGSDVERPKPLRNFCNTSLGTYTKVLLRFSHQKMDAYQYRIIKP